MDPLKLHLVGDHHPSWLNQFFLTKNILNMKHIFSFFSLFVLTSTAFGQLTKGHWLVGGNGRFYSYKNNYQSPSWIGNGKYTQIVLSPSVGYFLADKFSLGFKTTLSSNKGNSSFNGGNGATNTQRYLFGPFGRYYFLEAEKQTNILVEASYQTGIIREISDTKGRSNNFSISAGPVLYFNSSVGIEFLLGYATDKEKYLSKVQTEKRSGFQFSIGLQIHLIKCKFK
jgi:hypothetical protein